MWFLRLPAVAAAVLIANLVRPTPGVAQSEGQYTLASGDTVSISVFEEPDLQVEAEIGSSGQISFPLIGALNVTGLTTDELRRVVTEGLSGRYIKDPQVTVVVTEYRDFFINGAVELPGSYPYQPGLTVRKAISIAGGLTPRASTRKIYLIEEGDVAKKLDKVDMDHPVDPGDIIEIDEGLF